MNRYFFNLRHDGKVVMDVEGDEFANVEDARINAINSIRELVAARIKTGMIVTDEHMDVADGTGEILFSLSFHDVVRDQLRK